MKYYLIKNQEDVISIFTTEYTKECKVILCVGELSELVLFYQDIFIASVDLESSGIKIEDLKLEELQVA